MSSPRAFVRSFFRAVFRRIVSIYFRSIEVQGEVPTPQTGGRLFGANHTNGLVDPILVLTHAPCEISPIAKSTLFSIPGLRSLLDIAQAVPITRRRDVPDKDKSANDAVFERIAAHLARGGNILIFPEGTSHNEPFLLPLRSGAGEMLRAARRKGAEVTYQAVALEFDRRDLFRSRALVLYGPVRKAPPEIEDSELAKHITAELASDLSEMLVEGASWHDRELILRVAELYANQNADSETKLGALASVNSVGRRVELARKMLDATSPALQRVSEKVSGYFSKAERAHMTDAWVVHGVPTSKWSELLGLLLLAPLGLVGVVVFALPYRVIGIISRRITKEADVASTYKLGLGLAVYPTYAVAAAALTVVVLPWWAPLPAFVAIVLMAFVALDLLERFEALTLTRRANRAALEALRAERREVMAMLEATRIELGL